MTAIRSDITQHEHYEMTCEDAGLGYKRTEKLVFVEVFLQARLVEVKQNLYKNT